MSAKTTKIIYWIATGLISALMLFSASMYFLQTEQVKDIFTQLGFPTYLVYPIAIAKILAIIAIVSRWNATLKEWAYAGLFFEMLLAFSAHLNAKDGEMLLPLFGIALLLTSYFMERKMSALPA